MDLIKDNVEFLDEFIPKLIKAIDSEVDFLVKNMESAAFELLPQIYEGLEWSIKSISSLERLGIIGDLKIEDILNFLGEIEEAFKIRDLVLVSDLFEYEIKEILKRWHEKISALEV
jgi:hypothetical protein